MRCAPRSASCWCARRARPRRWRARQATYAARRVGGAARHNGAAGATSAAARLARGAAAWFTPLKALSSNADAQPFIAAMTRIHSGSAAFDYGRSRQELRTRMAACHAFEEDLTRYRLVFPERAA